MKKIEIWKKYRTRDGRDVRILCIDRNHPYYRVVGLVGINDEPCMWSEDGAFIANDEDMRELDLVEITAYEKISIDTPGWARKFSRTPDVNDWTPRYFAGVSKNGRPMCWDGGATSFTAAGRPSEWEEFTTIDPYE
jgi:hypothetical protein